MHLEIKWEHDKRHSYIKLKNSFVMGVHLHKLLSGATAIKLHEYLYTVRYYEQLLEATRQRVKESKRALKKFQKENNIISGGF